MHRIVGVFVLSVSAAVAVGQQHNEVSSNHASTEPVQRMPSAASTRKAAPATPKPKPVLPDAPSYTSNSHSDASPMQLESSTVDRANSSGAVWGATDRTAVSGMHADTKLPNRGYPSELTFTGGASGGNQTGGAHSGADSDSAASRGCNNSIEKAEGAGWFTTLVSGSSKGQHYCPLGEGGFWKRGTHALFAVQKYDGNSFNAYKVPGSVMGSGLPLGYPYGNYAGDRLAARYASTVGREALRNMFREFWPDISSHMMRRHGAGDGGDSAQ